jgi:hypothetical protein
VTRDRSTSSGPSATGPPAVAPRCPSPPERGRLGVNRLVRQTGLSSRSITSGLRELARRQPGNQPHRHGATASGHLSERCREISAPPWRGAFFMLLRPRDAPSGRSNYDDGSLSGLPAAAGDVRRDGALRCKLPDARRSDQEKPRKCGSTLAALQEATRRDPLHRNGSPGRAGRI